MNEGWAEVTLPRGARDIRIERREGGAYISYVDADGCRVIFSGRMDRIVINTRGVPEWTKLL